MSTQSVLDHHLNAFREGLDAIMSDYTNESVFFTPQATLIGIQPIRDFFHAFLTSSPPELISAMTLSKAEVNGDHAYIHWKADPFIPFASDTFAIRDGKIVMQSFAVFSAGA
jgi:ketosteroid isomerase-like protein